MRIMEAVYPITALYFGPVAVWFYQNTVKQNRPSTSFSMQQKEKKIDEIRWQHVSEADLDCGAGCTLGHIIGEWLVIALGITILGKALFADYVFAFAFVWTLGILFQYFMIVPMRQNLSKLQSIVQATKADTASIVAFQIGLFAGMYVYQELIFEHPLSKTTASYWFLMQLSMVLGFFTAYPVNRLLIQRGIKEKM